jgi:outer membrane protein TolC
MGFPNVDIPALNRDQYGVTVEVSQSLYDGGVIAAKRENLRAGNEVDKQDVAVGLYAVRERIDQLFFGILLCDALMEQNRLFEEELRRSYDQIAALVRGGLAGQSDLDAVRVEQLKAQQALSRTIHSRQAFLAMLSAFIGEKPEGNVRLQKPDVPYPVAWDIRRPELLVFDNRDRLVETTRHELLASLRPKVGLFLTGGYGNPGLNMLHNGFEAYYLGGIRLTWNFGSFYTRKNALRLLDNQQNAIRVQRETFLFNTALSKKSKEIDIDNYRELLRSDNEIITLRHSVKAAAEAKLSQGTITIADFLREVTAEELAQQERIVHEIEYARAVYALKHITNH